jgi:hypothetical protein
VADGADHSTDFSLEISGVVDHVEVGVAHPGGGRVRVELAGEFDAFGTTTVVLQDKEKMFAG